MSASGASGKHVRGCFEFPVPKPRSDSDSETDYNRPPRSDRELLLCEGCNKPFTNISSLRCHRNSWRLPACRDVASALKRPRIVRVDDSTWDAYDQIEQMMGDEANSKQAHGAVSNPRLQPRDEVGDVQSQPKVYAQFATCLKIVYTTFKQGLQNVDILFTHSFISLH
jgi:hypothetical protein